jgi:hypothetical protein
VDLHRLADRDPRHHLLGNLAGHPQRIDADDGHHRHRRARSLHELSQVHEAALHVAVERRADVGVAKLTVGEFHRRLGRGDIRLKVLGVLERQVVAGFLRLQHRVRIVERLARHQLAFSFLARS